MPNPLHTIDLGRMPYPAALARQRAVHAQVLAGDAEDTLLLVEHDPVITVSARKGATAHVLAPPADLERLGIEVHETDRGGDVTYHGPGQIVAYPILRMMRYRLNVGRYMRLLEQVIIDTLETFDIDAHAEAGATGVWIADALDGPAAKIAALGVRVRRNVTMHGLALNVTTDLTHFDTIVPCGLAGRRVTSMQRLLGGRTPDLSDVKRELTGQLNHHLRCHKAKAAR